MPTSGFSIKPLKVKLSAGEQKATECLLAISSPDFSGGFSAWLHVFFFRLAGVAMPAIPPEPLGSIPPRAPS